MAHSSMQKVDSRIMGRRGAIRYPPGMTRKRRWASAAALCAGAVVATGTAMRTELVLPSESVRFKPATPGSFKAPLWGAQSGEHATLTRLVAGFRSGLHTHTREVRLVVVDGTVLHTGPDGRTVELGRGSYLMVPGGIKHDTGCGVEGDCLFVESLPGPFDMKPAK
jgi:quercetin dioxygenase-like cupin family protein